MNINDLTKEYAAAVKEHERLDAITKEKYGRWQEFSAPAKKEWADALHAANDAYSKVYSLQKKFLHIGAADANKCS